jgi:hypothetical protein
MKNFEQNEYFNDAINELFQTLNGLKHEYQNLVNVNYILINSNKALKNLLISKNIFTDKQFQKAYENELKKLESEYQKHMEIQDQIRMEMLLNNTQTGNA